MTERTPSSVALGARPSPAQMRANSSAVRPCSTASASVTATANDCMQLVSGHDRGAALMRAFRPGRQRRLEQLEPVFPVEQFFGGVFGVRHQPKDVAAGVDDAGDVVE